MIAKKLYQGELYEIHRLTKDITLNCFINLLMRPYVVFITLNPTFVAVFNTDLNNY